MCSGKFFESYNEMMATTAMIVEILLTVIEMFQLFPPSHYEVQLIIIWVQEAIAETKFF